MGSCCKKQKAEVIVIKNPCPCVACKCYNENIRCPCFDIEYLNKNYEYSIDQYNAF